jgi:hypothetical protein
MKKRQWVFVICFILAAPAFAQTAAEIEKLLETEAVNYEQAAWLVLEAAGIPAGVPADSSGSYDKNGAFNFAAQKGWLPRNAAPADKARLEGLSLIIMRSFEIKGGIFYSLLKNPHYAYRELVYQEFIQGGSDPQMTVSGELLLFIVNRVLSRVEEQ